MLSNDIRKMTGKDYLIVFPSGWESRPWDNIYRIGQVIEDEKKIKIDISDGWYLTVHNDALCFGAGNSMFLVVGNSRLDRPSGAVEFNKGIVAFIYPELNSQGEAYKLYEVLNNAIIK